MHTYTYACTCTCRPSSLASPRADARQAPKPNTRSTPPSQERASQLEAAEVANMVALLGSAVETQMQRIELKLSHLDEITTLIHREREQVTRGCACACACYMYTCIHVYMCTLIHRERKQLTLPSLPAAAAGRLPMAPPPHRCGVTGPPSLVPGGGGFRALPPLVLACAQQRSTLGHLFESCNRPQLERMRHSVLADRMVTKRHGGAPSVPAPPTSASTAIHLPPNTPSTMPPSGPQAANPILPPSAPLAVAATSTTAAPPNPAQPPTTAVEVTAGRAGAGEV